MVLLDVLCLVFALVAVAFAVVALVRARAADDRAAVAAAAVARAETTAHAAAAGVEHLESQVAQARREAASATQQAGRAAQAAAQASAAAAASRREAEAASDKAEHADAEARAAIENATRPVVTLDEVETDDETTATDETPPVGHATVRRAEDHDVAGSDTGATERVVQVAWRLERVRGGIWALRNTGLASARDALLSDATVPPKYVRPDEVIPRDVDRDDVLQFRVMAARGAPPPRIRVTWREAAGSPAYSREFTVLTAS
ncbi:hypothetical protein [Humibacter sp. RRB41]|uniref:hypothetical protein n=1 Tax=Humibacter sp. RRB41 TaxID=2919946 RepID=UPI001FAAA30C|nr:hypothetical protein [Humibacter sp. RRB41]